MEQNEDIELIINRLLDKDTEVQRAALDFLLQIVRGVSTLNMNSTTNYDYLDKNLSRIEEIYQKLQGENKKYLADILSMICVFTDSGVALFYRAEGGLLPLATFGYLYVKKILSAIIKVKINEEKIRKIAEDGINFLFSHNLESDAIDYSYELNLLELILQNVDTYNSNRVILYLNDLKKYDLKIEPLILEIFLKIKDVTAALIHVLNHKDSTEKIEKIFELANYEEKIQMAFILGRTYRSLPQKTEFLSKINRDLSLYTISSNYHLESFFEYLIKDLQIAKPKKPLEFLKGNYLLRSERDIASKYLSAFCMANCFVHLGFNEDSIFLPKDQEFIVDFETLEQNVKTEMLSVFSSFGAINLFSPKLALENLNEIIFSANEFKKSSSILGLAIANSKIYDDNHTILAFLRENLETNCQFQLISSLLGVQMIYSNSKNENVKSLLVEKCYTPFCDVNCFAVFCLGSVFCGSSDEEIYSVMLQVLSDDKNCESKFFIFAALGLALLFWNDKSVLERLDVIKSVTPKFTHINVLLKCFSNYGTGDVELMNELFSDCFEENNTNDNLLRSVGLLGVTVLSLGDELFSKMALRILNSVSLLEADNVKSTVALCIAMLSPSNPQVELVDILVKNTNSSDYKTVMNSLIGLGIIGAGTNNTKISEVFERYYSYSNKPSKVINSLMIGQGLLHLGKGTMTLSPFLYNKRHLNMKSFIGLIAAVTAYLDPDFTPVNTKYSFLNYFFIQASSLKSLICVDKNIEFMKVPLRIGIPVNLVGVVGRPKKITSIQTHDSPIVVQDNEMVELGKTGVCGYIEDVIVVGE